MTAPSHEALPIECTPVHTSDGWSVRLQVRAEDVTTSKQTFIRERVVLKRNRIENVVQVRALLRREQLRATTAGGVEVSEEQTTQVPTT